MSMVLAILCCITAAKVEGRRLDVVVKHGLLDKPDEPIPMTVFWLLPQFLLLGAFDGMFAGSTIHFYKSQAPPSTTNNLLMFSYFVYGAGFMGSSVSVYIVGNVSQRGGKPSWFQNSLNKSRLDKYYWTLSWLLAINLAVFVVVAVWYIYQNSETDNGNEDAPQNGEVVEPFEDDAQCCC